MSRDLHGLKTIIGATTFTQRGGTALQNLTSGGTQRNVVTQNPPAGGGQNPTAGGTQRATGGATGGGVSFKQAVDSVLNNKPSKQSVVSPSSNDAGVSNAKAIADKARADAAKAAGQAKAAAAKAKAKEKMSSDASHMSSKATATASKLSRKYPRESRKLARLSASVQKKATTKLQGDPLNTILGELLGLDMTMQALDFNEQAVQQAMAWWNNYVTAINADIVCGDVMAVLDPLIDQLTKINQVEIAGLGKNIVARCQSIINTFNPDAESPDLSVGAAVQVIQSDANKWITQAQGAIASGGTGVDALANAQAVQAAQALLSTIQGLVQQLTMFGNTTLAQTGQGLVTQLQAIIANPNDPNLPTTFAQVQNAAATFQQQAQEAMLASPDGPTSPFGGGAPAGGGGGDGGFGGGSSEGGGFEEEGYAEEGGGEGYAEEEAPTEEAPMDTESFEETANANTVEQGDPNDPFANIVGELTGRRRRLQRQYQLMGVSGQKKPEKKQESSGSKFVDYFHKPLWTGSPVKIWQAAVGAGVTITLGGALLAFLRGRKN